MIYGIGTDLVEPARIENSLEKYGERFIKRILTDPEYAEYGSSSKPVMFLASRFAAKEAFSKAIGTGLRHPVNFNYIQVTHDSLGKPYFKFHDDLERFINNQGIKNHFLSISDEISLACAFVILEK